MQWQICFVCRLQTVGQTGHRLKPSAHLFAIPVPLLHRHCSLRHISEKHTYLLSCTHAIIMNERLQRHDSSCLERLISRAHVSSAALMVLPLGVLCKTVDSYCTAGYTETAQVKVMQRQRMKTYFMTIIPFLVAASTSTLSTPVPALPMIRRLSAALITSAVTLVADRTTRPS